MTTAKNKHTPLAMIAYLIFFAPQFSSAKEDEFVRYHQAQAIGLLIFALALQGAISIIGYWGGPQRTLAWVVRAALIYLVIKGMMAASQGEQRPLPWIGGYAARAFERRRASIERRGA